MVYLAGPLFNPAERETMNQLARVLEQRGFTTFLPHRDGLEFARVSPHLQELGLSEEQANSALLKAIDALDCYQVVVRCGSLVFNAAGRVPDDGAVAELAMAFLAGKPTVYFKFGDVRTLIAGVDNPLVRGRCGGETVHEFDDVPAALERRIAELSPDPEYQFHCTEYVWRLLDAGRAIWDMLATLNQGEFNAGERAKRIAVEVKRVLASFSIRQVTTQDLDLFRSLRLEALLKEPQAFGAKYDDESRMSSEEWRKRIEDPTSAFFILMFGDTPVGLTGIRSNRDNSAQAILIASYIKREFRGNGGSTFLYRARLEWARAKGFEEVIVSHRASNEASRRANQKHGFILTHSEPHLWNDGQVEDNLFYSLKSA